MTITSKLVFRTLVVLTGLGIFVRGIWLSRTQLPLDNWLDIVNCFIVFVFLIIVGAISLVGLIRSIGFLISDYWTGEKQLFKPFKINFKFKK